MGRAPCCDKANVKKGPWSPEEDAKLKSFIEKHGTGGNWIALPQKIGLKRCGKSCRLRWLNYLRPNIKHGDFSEEEDNLICSLYISIGSRWSIIAAQLPGRTDNDIKNYWNTRLKKKLLGDQRKQITKRRSGNNPKREVKKEIVGDCNDLVANNIGIMNYRSSNHSQIYCPAMALLTPTVLQPPTQHNNHEPLLPSNFEDHTSIRKLLVKLGGRFSDDNSQAASDCLPDIADGSLSGNSSYEQLVTTNSRIPEPCKKDDVGFFPVVHLPRSDNRFAPGFGTNEVYSQDGLQGLEFLLGYDETIARDSPRLFSGSYGGCGPVAGWDEISNLVHTAERIIRSDTKIGARMIG